MISNVGYRFTVFADYSNLCFSRESMNKIFDAFNGIDIVPAVVQEVSPDAGVSQRMRFVTNDGISIALMSSRIDIDIISGKKEGFLEEEKGKVSSILLQYMTRIYSAFGKMIQDANRMAWGSTFVYFDISSEEKRNFRQRFIQPIRFYRDISVDEFNVCYVGRKKIQITSCDQEEINILTQIIEYVSDNEPRVYGNISGYIISFDINTVPENKKNRFGAQTFDSFINIAREIQKDVGNDFLNV